MPEKEPTPISRGIELQKNKVEEIQKKALAQYRILADLSKELEAKIDIELLNPSAESTEELAKLFNQKHVLDGIGYELEDFILQGFENQDELQGRWVALEQRLSSLQQN